jgi:hypothetical protein
MLPFEVESMSFIKNIWPLFISDKPLTQTATYQATTGFENLLTNKEQSEI